MAIQREVLLRKSGKWANHTQMIALFMLPIHNNESLLHQARTDKVRVSSRSYVRYPRIQGSYRG